MDMIAIKPWGFQQPTRITYTRISIYSVTCIPSTTDAEVSGPAADEDVTVIISRKH